MSRQDCPLVTMQGLILLQICENLTQTIREIAFNLGITERTVIHNMKDLEKAGFLKKQTVGRRNIYSKGPNLPLDLYGNLRAIVRAENGSTSKEIAY